MLTFWPLMEFIAYLAIMAIATAAFHKNYTLMIVPIGVFLLIGYYLSIPYFGYAALIVFIMFIAFILAYRLYLEEAI